MWRSMERAILEALHNFRATKSATVGKQPVIAVTLKGIIEQLADGQDVPKKQANALLAGMIDKVTTHLKGGDRIRISGLGILEVRKREARIGRNPASGETIRGRPSLLSWGQATGRNPADGRARDASRWPPSQDCQHEFRGEIAGLSRSPSLRTISRRGLGGIDLDRQQRGDERSPSQ
jgi:nucleoid DNA-binding protein